MQVVDALHARRSPQVFDGLVGGEGVGPEHVPGGVDGHGVQAAEAHVDADPHVGKSMDMQRLTGLDATFLYLETPSIHMHVASTAVFDPSNLGYGLIAATLNGSYDLWRNSLTLKLGAAVAGCAVSLTFRRPVIELMFQRGSFTAESTQLVAADQ